jgi:hypothetical protein
MAKGDPELNEQWNDMSQSGFFNQTDAPAVYPIAFGIDEQADFGKAFEQLAMVEQALERRIGLELHIRCAADIVPVYGRFAEPFEQYLAMRKEEQLKAEAEAKEADVEAAEFSEENSGEDSTEPRKGELPGEQAANEEQAAKILINTGFEGEQAPGEELALLLDREKIALQLNYTLGNGEQTKWPRHWLSKLENEGFLFPFRIRLTTELVLNAARRPELIAEFEHLLRDAPNRPVDLFIERPLQSNSSAELDSYYDALEALVLELLQLDADITLLTYFQRYLAGIMGSLRQQSLISLRLGKGAGQLHLGLLSEHSPFALFEANKDALGEKFQQSQEIIDSLGEENCEHCPLIFVCPKSFNSAYFHQRLQGNEATAAKIFSRECQIHQQAIVSIFENMLDYCDQNAEQTIPLKMQVAEDKSFVLSPLNEL